MNHMQLTKATGVVLTSSAVLTVSGSAACNPLMLSPRSRLSSIKDSKLMENCCEVTSVSLLVETVASLVLILFCEVVTSSKSNKKAFYSTVLASVVTPRGLFFNGAQFLKTNFFVLKIKTFYEAFDLRQYSRQRRGLD